MAERGRKEGQEGRGERHSSYRRKEGSQRKVHRRKEDGRERPMHRDGMRMQCAPFDSSIYARKGVLCRENASRVVVFKRPTPLIAIWKFGYVKWTWCTKLYLYEESNSENSGRNIWG